MSRRGEGGRDKRERRGGRDEREHGGQQEGEGVVVERHTRTTGIPRGGTLTGIYVRPTVGKKVGEQDRATRWREIE